MRNTCRRREKDRKTSLHPLPSQSRAQMAYLFKTTNVPQQAPVFLYLNAFALVNYETLFALQIKHPSNTADLKADLEKSTEAGKIF